MGRGVPLAGIGELTPAVNVPQSELKPQSAIARASYGKSRFREEKTVAVGELKLQPDGGARRVEIVFQAAETEELHIFIFAAHEDVRR